MWARQRSAAQGSQIASSAVRNSRRVDCRACSLRKAVYPHIPLTYFTDWGLNEHTRASVRRYVMAHSHGAALYMGTQAAAVPNGVRTQPDRPHCASGEGRNFQSLARPRRRARRSPVPPLDQLRVPPARHTLFAPQRARKPYCKLIIIAAALCAARASAQNPPSDDLQRESFCSAKLCCNEEFRWL